MQEEQKVEVLARIVTDDNPAARAKAKNQPLWDDIDNVGLGTLDASANQSKDEAKQALLQQTPSLDIPNKSDQYNATSTNVELVAVQENNLEEGKDTSREKPIFNPKETIQNDSFEGRPTFNALSPKGNDMEDNEANLEDQ